MADPATIYLAGKAAVTAMADGRIRKLVGWVIAAILSPVIVVVAIVCGMLSGTTDHNNEAVNLCFSGGVISGRVPENYRGYIEDMRNSFSLIDSTIAAVSSLMEGGDSLDSTRLKSIFYSLYFGADSPSLVDHLQYVDCFVMYEERTRTVRNEDGTDGEESYTVAVPIQDLSVVYGNIASAMGTNVNPDMQTNANSIYGLVLYGRGAVGLQNYSDPGEPLGDGSYQALIQEAEKYIGYPYVWGGSSPSTSFDCSGYICWVYTQSGVYNLPRDTAWGIFNKCTVIPKTEARPGDLIFFTGTYASSTPVSHVGMFVGNNKMLHCGKPIGYANIDSAYWIQKYYAMGRLQ